LKFLAIDWLTNLIVAASILSYGMSVVCVLNTCTVM